MRIRVHGTVARVEVDEGAFGKVIKGKMKLSPALRGWGMFM